MRGLFAVDARADSWASVHSVLKDPRVIVRCDDRSFTRVPAPSEEVPLTVVVPVQDVDWTLWDAIFGLNFQRYTNWKILFVIGDPELNDKAVSVIKTHRRFLPECNIFTPKRKLTIGEMLNVAIGSIDSDYVCFQMPLDHMHPSALAAMSEAILEHKADFYHTLRYTLSHHNWVTCAPAIECEDDWDGSVFKYRGLFTFRKQAITSVGGFPVGSGLSDSMLVTVYDLLDVESNVHAMNEYLYLSRGSDAMVKTRGRDGVEWWQDLIKRRWPHRERPTK